MASLSMEAALSAAMSAAQLAADTACAAVSKEGLPLTLSALALALSLRGPVAYLWGWLKVLAIAFERQDYDKFKAFLKFAWQNKAYVEHYNDGKFSAQMGSDNVVRVVTDETVTAEDIHDCFVERNSILLWKNFIPADVMKQFENIGPEMFEDKTYFFAQSETVPIKRNGKLFRPLIPVNVRDAMRQMKKGERLYLGFNTALADDNPGIKSTLEGVLDKINAQGQFFNKFACLTHSFLYYGNQFQAALHQAVVQDFSIQLANSKTWRFIRPEFTPQMRAFRADVPGVLYSSHGLIEGTGIPYSEVTAHPGDLMVFPEHWWHEVHNIEPDSYGLMIGFRDMSPNHLFGGIFKKPSLFFHKTLSLLDIFLHPIDKDAPENAKAVAGVCVHD